MNEPQKKSIHDRKDRVFVRKQDSLHIIVPYMMKRRCDNEGVLSETIDVTALNEYLEKKNAANTDGFKYTWFHCIAAAIAKVMVLRPKMNYFFSGYRLYEHRDVELAFMVKRKFDDKSEEAVAKIKVDREGASPVSQVHDKVRDFVTKVRVRDEKEGSTKAMDLLHILPRPVLKLFFGTLRLLEYFGIYPSSLMKIDPCFSSVYISNLGSIKMKADYHHLFEWGTVSFFVVISEKKMRPVFKDDGSYEMHDTIKLGLTIDERIADGYYFSKSIKMLRHLLQHPELLDLDVAEPVEFE